MLKEDLRKEIEDMYLLLPSASVIMNYLKHITSLGPIGLDCLLKKFGQYGFVTSCDEGTFVMGTVGKGTTVAVKKIVRYR